MDNPRPKPPREALPRKSAAPLLWVSLIVVAAALLTIVWNLLQ